MTFKADLQKQTQYDELLTQAEQANGLPSGLLKLVMMIENRNNPANRESPAGARGIMQIMPSNFESLGITDPDDPAQSINGAAKLMAELSQQYEGNVGAMLAHYNGGNKAGRAYLQGQQMNPETTQYLEYAKPYLEGGETAYGSKIVSAANVQLDNVLPSDLQDTDLSDENSFYTGLDAQAEQQLSEEAKVADWSAKEAFQSGFQDTITYALYHAGSREIDPTFSLKQSDFDNVKVNFPEGLSADETDRIYNSRSAADLQYNIDRIKGQHDQVSRIGQQDGWGRAGAMAVTLSGGLLDPASLPLAFIGPSFKAYQAMSIGRKVLTAAATAAAGAAIASPIVQNVDKGSWSGEQVVQNMGAAAIFGASISGLANAGKVADVWRAAADEPIVRRMNEGEFVTPPEAAVNEDNIYSGLNFEDPGKGIKAPDGQVVGVGASHVIRAASDWSENVSPAMQAVQAKRDAWYKSGLRTKLFGWADSEGVRLAMSKSKTARFVQAMWSGNAAGIGKQEAVNAAVLKSIYADDMSFKYIPELKAAFTEALDPQGKLDFMAGGAKQQLQQFSRDVQLERLRHREYRKMHNGNSEGYVTDAPVAVRRAAELMDNLHNQSRELHVNNRTEHWEQLQNEDSVGYVEQRPNYQLLNDVNNNNPAKRRAYLSMVKDDYMAAAESHMKAMRGSMDDWIEKAYQRAEKALAKTDADGKAIPATWVDEFLANPEEYFVKQMDKLENKVKAEMETRAYHWWENALRDPETRYQNSEASLMQLAKEMADEWFTGKDVDAELVKAFQKSLTKKWSYTRRRELNLLNYRMVDGEKVYLLDMFDHDIFSTATRQIQDTAGRVAMAKTGWRTEQDIADTLDALRSDGASQQEIDAAKHISDLILNRAMGLDNSPLVQSLSNMVHAQMMGKLPISVIADMPAIIGNLGVSGMVEALGRSAEHVISGKLFVKNGRPTKLGNDLDAMLKGLTGHDHLLWVPQQLDSNGLAMEVGGSLLRRTAAAARFTNTIAGTNWTTRTIGSAITRTTTNRLHKFLKTGKGIDQVRLEDVGLSANDLKAIKEDFDKFSTKTEFGLDRWNPYTREKFIAAAHKFNSQNRIDTAYAGEKPKWERENILGYLFSRFRIIGIRAQEKVLMRNMTMMDSNTVQMMTAGLAFATFMAYARIHLDAATSRDGNRVLKERLTPLGVTQQVMQLSSVLGLSAEGMNLFSLLSGGQVPTGSDTPFTGAVSNMVKAVGAVGKSATGQGTAQGTLDAVSRALPGGNSYLLMGVKNNLN